MTARPLSAAETLDWLRLARSERVGPVLFRELIGRYGRETMEEVFLDVARGRTNEAPVLPTELVP